MDHPTSAENWSNIAAACFRFPSFFLFLRFRVFDSNTFYSSGLPLHLDVEDEDVEDEDMEDNTSTAAQPHNLTPAVTISPVNVTAPAPNITGRTTTHIHRHYLGV